MERLRDQVEKESRDLSTLGAVIDDGPIGIVRLAEETEIPEHKVRYSLRMLEDDGLVEPTPQGAIPVDDIDERVAEINAGLDRLVGRLEELEAAIPPAEAAE